MDLLLLNTEFSSVAVIDMYESFIWTDRYNSYGDFELCLPATSENIDMLRKNYYLRNRNSDHLMILEKREIATDVESGSKITISGRSLESILERRIIWKQMTVSGNLQNAIKTLLNKNIISPSINARKISNFVFQESTDPDITSLSIDKAQYTGDVLYDVIVEMCQDAKIGFKIILNDENQFVFSLYKGADRSYAQDANPYVVFSPNFDNLLNSSYLESDIDYRNVTLVGGEGEGSERKYVTVGSASGLSRRELFTDARDISSNVIDDETLTPEEYNQLLTKRGSEKLAEQTKVTAFEGEVDYNSMYKYMEDYFTGDIVQIVNEYGIESSVRVIETVFSYDDNGQSIYPTFKALDEEDET